MVRTNDCLDGVLCSPRFAKSTHAFEIYGGLKRCIDKKTEKPENSDQHRIYST